MAENHVITNVPRGAGLEIEVKQEGQEHAVTGRLRHHDRDIASWPGGELEDRVTSVTLASSGLYDLFIQIAFFGPMEEQVAIGLTIHDGVPMHEHRTIFRGRAGDVRVFIAAISVI